MLKQIIFNLWNTDTSACRGVRHVLDNFNKCPKYIFSLLWDSLTHVWHLYNTHTRGVRQLRQMYVGRKKEKRCDYYIEYIPTFMYCNMNLYFFVLLFFHMLELSRVYTCCSILLEHGRMSPVHCQHWSPKCSCLRGCVF